MPRRLLAALAMIPALALAHGPSAEPAPMAEGALKLRATYDGVLLVKVLDMSIEQQVSPTAFETHATLKSSGLLALFKKIDVQAGSEGRIVAAQPQPSAFSHVNNDGQYNRQVRVNWSAADVATWTSVAYPSPGDPAPTRNQKLAAADPLTALVRIALAPAGKAPCANDSLLFDGRQLYRLRFGEARPRPLSEHEQRLGLTGGVRCALTFSEVAGFDRKAPDKKNMGLGDTPVSLDLARTAETGPWVITALRGHTPLGEARIVIRDLKAG
jgi:hypothetical protein